MMRQLASKTGGAVDANRQDESTGLVTGSAVEQGSDWGDRWWVRYPVAVLIIIVVVWLLETNPKMNEWKQLVIGAAGVIYPLILMRELAGALLVAALAYWLFGVVAALPVGVAIIIGALIIANARR